MDDFNYWAKFLSGICLGFGGKLDNKPCSRPWKIHDLFVKFSRFSSVFGNVSFCHTLREANFMVDSLAKQGVNRMEEHMAWIWDFWVHRIHEFLACIWCCYGYILSVVCGIFISYWRLDDKNLNLLASILWLLLKSCCWWLD